MECNRRRIILNPYWPVYARSYLRIGISRRLDYFVGIIPCNSAVTIYVTGSRGAAYFRVSFVGKAENIGISIDEDLSYTATWHGEPKRLDDSIKVKAENVVGGTAPLYVNISAEDGYACSTTVSALEAALDAGGLVVAKIATDAGALFAQLCSYETSADNTYGRIVMFALGALTFTLTPTASGYNVAVSGD